MGAAVTLVVQGSFGIGDFAREMARWEEHCLIVNLSASAASVLSHVHKAQQYLGAATTCSSPMLLHLPLFSVVTQLRQFSRIKVVLFARTQLRGISHRVLLLLLLLRYCNSSHTVVTPIDAAA